MATIPVIPTFEPGIRMHSGERLNQIGGPLASLMGQAGALPPNFPSVQSAMDGLTAKAGGGQSGATPLPMTLNRVATVATAGDSVMLPASRPGLQISVTNSSANPMQLFGVGNDTINGSPAATGLAQAAGKTATYTCYSAGAWFQNLSA